MDFPRSFLYAGPQYTTRAQGVPAPLFRRKFIAPAGAQAELVITGLGFYEVWLNGAHLTKGFLAPYISAADDLIYYDRYDLTEHLLEGENVLAIELGNGFFNDPAGYVWDFDRAPWIGAPRTAFRLTLKKDGEETRIESDEQVLTHPSPILMDDYRWGEIYDARKELPGWTLPGFDDRLWAHAMPCEAPSGEARLCEAEPLAVREILKPVSIEKQDEGYLYDFGVDTTGICRVRICGHAGQKIALYHGEKLKGGKFDMDNIKFEHRYGPDDRVQRDVLILKEGENDYTPTFTYHGFRYVLVKGLEETQATEELLTMLVISSALPEVGGFDCSDEMANTLQKLTRNSDLSNFIYFPTDCPQREKNGWTADASLSSEHILLNLGAEKSYREWLRNICKAQSDAGALPGVVPTGGWGFDWGNGPAWDNVLFNLPYNLFRLRGDTQTIRECAPNLMRYLTYIGGRLDADGTLAIGLGDWCPVGREAADYVSPLRFTDTVLVSDMARKAEKMFAAVGMLRESAYAKALADDTRAAVRRNLIDFDTMTVSGSCQTSQAMALYYGMFNREEEQKAFARLLDFIHDKDDHIDTGVLGARVIFHVLSKFGHGDLAMKMIVREDYPSYGNWVARGATSLWEMMMPDDNVGSMNHHFWGDISGWFIQCAAGLRPNPDADDALRVDFEPGLNCGLARASAHTQAACGETSLRWRLNGDQAQIELTLPESAHGEVILPEGWTFGRGKSRLPARTGAFIALKQ